MFRDRQDAGGRLAHHLSARLAGATGLVVLGIPRGGVVVAAPVAAALDAPLDVVVPRKVGAPGEPELAVGAVAIAGDERISLFDDEMVARLAIPDSYLREEAARQEREVLRRVEAYRGGRPPAPVAGRTLVVVDDGVATGWTARAAAELVLRLGPEAVLVAAPVAPVETVREFRDRGLRLEVLETPSPFVAVGQFYTVFGPVSDDEVRRILRAATTPA